MTDQLQEDCVLAIAKLVGRSGGREFEVGWLYDPDEPEFLVKGACWYASAKYRGARLTMDDQASPALACDGLAHRILDGGRCTHCGARTTTAQTALGTYVHARPPEPGEQTCTWRREGDDWKRGCE